MLTIDTRSREPIYSQLEKQIIKLINLGVYEDDSMLPSVRTLALELGVNPNTVARAYKSLEQKGVIYTIAGKGVFVSARELGKINTIVLENVKAVLADARASGVRRDEIIALANNLWEDSND